MAHLYRLIDKSAVDSTASTTKQEITPPSGHRASAELHSLADIIDRQSLKAVFQPILGVNTRNYLGYEGLIRPMPNTLYTTPCELLAAAETYGMRREFERACRHAILHAFAEQDLPGTLFINASPTSLFDTDFLHGSTPALLRKLGLRPQRIVIEITENEAIEDFGAFRDVLKAFRDQGYRIAIDDLGQGMSNLRMWTEVNPDFVKIDRHFIDGIAEDALKYHLVRAIHGMADTCGACLIAEGIERMEDFVTVREIGVHFAQGFLIATPETHPQGAPSTAFLAASEHALIAQGRFRNARVGTEHAGMLARKVEAVAPHTLVVDVLRRFGSDPDLRAIPVVGMDGEPVGVLNREVVAARTALPYQHEICSRQACTQFMDAAPLIVDEHTPASAISRLLTHTNRHALHEHFLITASGRYLGLGNSRDLVKLITDMQIRAARYANPLSQLPGTVPIDEHIDHLVASGRPFVACSADLDAFKPFNEMFGYRRGDELIQMLAGVLSEACDPHCDVLGHIGGDDFLIVFQSDDWQRRCETALAHFVARLETVLDRDTLSRGNISVEDRGGRKVNRPLPSLSIGALEVLPGSGKTHYEISEAATEARKQAKRIPGNSLFVERRNTFRIVRNEEDAA